MPDTIALPPIQLFVTGGTIDKDYQTKTGELYFPNTHINKLLEQANCTLDLQINVLMQKDSLEMNHDDRALISKACEQCTAQQIVITHGTDTMVDTALVLKNKPSLQDKTIVLTGAMRPFQLGQSDASFNIGAALMAVQTTRPGVYISMNGRLFSAQQVVKNRRLGVFENV